MAASTVSTLQSFPAPGSIPPVTFYNMLGLANWLNLNPIYTIICILLTLFGHVVGIINGILNIINGLITKIETNMNLITNTYGNSVESNKNYSELNVSYVKIKGDQYD